MCWVWRSPFRCIPQIKLFVNQNHAPAPASSSEGQPATPPPPLQATKKSSHFSGGPTAQKALLTSSAWGHRERCGMLCKAVAGLGGAAHGTDPACASPKPSWKGEILCFTPGGCSLGWQWPRVVTPPAWFGLPGGSLGLGNLGWVPCTPRPRGACAPPGPGARGVGRGLRGAAPRGAQRLRRDSEVQNVCGQPAQLPDACKGSSWG